MLGNAAIFRGSMRARRSGKLVWAAIGCALPAAFLSARAYGFCRAVTVTPPPGYDAALTGCFAPTVNPKTGGSVVDLYWKNFCVGYSIQQGASKQVTLEQATRVAAQAFAAWSGATCDSGRPPSIAAINEDPVECNRVEYNPAGPNQHVIVFRDEGWPYQDSSNTLGLTTLTVNYDTGEIDDADIEINSHDFRLTVEGSQPDDGGGSYDLLGILTHEAGHFLGLAHSDDKNAVMYAHYALNVAALTADDVAGICAIDGPDSARSTSSGSVMASACNATPENGFSTLCGGAIVGDAGTMTCPSGLRCSVGACPTRRGIGPAIAALVAVIALVRRHRRRSAGRLLKVRISLTSRTG
jgi:hypothetical protein